jgi:hypothetical protein
MTQMGEMEGCGPEASGTTQPANAREKWYRWLLALYPRDHRREHAEEMVGVLFAAVGAAPVPGLRPAAWARRLGQDTADSADLIAGALRIRGRMVLKRIKRARWLSRTARDQRWSDALAVVSVVAPLLMLVAALAEFSIPQVAASSMTGHPHGGFSVGGIAWFGHQNPQLGFTSFNSEVAGLPADLLIAAVLVGVAVFCLRTPASRRVLVLLAIPVLPYAFLWQEKLAGDLLGGASSVIPSTIPLLYLPSLILACLIVAGTRLARHRSAGPARQVSRTTRAGPRGAVRA